MIRHATKAVLMLIASAALLALVVILVGFDATVDALAQAGPLAFLSTGVALAAVLVIQAVAWAVLNRPVAHRIPFGTLLGATTAGMAGNILTPSTYLGGEPVKVIYAGRKTGLPYQELAGTVLLAKYLEALSFVLALAVVSTVAAVALRDVLFTQVNLPLGVAAVAAIGAALALFAVLCVSLARRWTPVSRVVSVLVRLRIARRFFLRLLRRSLRMEQQVSRVFREEHLAVWPVFALYALTHAVMFVKPLAFFYFGWRIGLGFAELGLIFLTCQVLLAFQLTPSGVGTLDGGLLGMLAVAGIAISQPQCAAFLLCVRFWDAVLLAAGAFLAARAGATFFTKPKDPDRWDEDAQPGDQGPLQRERQARGSESLGS